MTFFASEIITPPTHLPVTVAAADMALAAAVVEEIERTVLWRGVSSQERRILIDGPLPPRIEIEPTNSITITRWTDTDAASVVAADNYHVISRDPQGTVIEPLPWYSWPSPERSIGSFSINYECGFGVSPESSPGAGDAINMVPPSVQLMLKRAIAFRAGSGLAGITIGSLTIGLADSYKTDRIPAAITSMGRAWAYRPGLFSARP